jgi:DNA-binding CsgD family transcriptional regulator
MIATVESPAIRPRQFSAGAGHLTPKQKIEIRTLYLVHNLGATEIAKRLGCNLKATSNLITHAGWTKIRSKNWLKAEADVSAIVENDVAQVSQQIAVESEELTLGSLNILRRSIAEGNAKDMQMASGAARNLVDIFRKCRGMDNKATEPTGSSTNVNMFVFATPAVAKTERNVTPSATIAIS